MTLEKTNHELGLGGVCFADKTPQTLVYLEMIQAGDRPGFAVHLDPVNINSSPRRFYFSGDFIRDCFQKLGPYIASCHAKDIQMVRRDAPAHRSDTDLSQGTAVLNSVRHL